MKAEPGTVIPEKEKKHSFAEAVRNFNPVNLSAKTESEIIDAALNVYLKFPGSVSVSYFRINQDDFSFKLTGIKGNTDWNTADRRFNSLVEFGAVAQALSSVQIFYHTFAGEAADNCVVVPLSEKSGIIGLVIIVTQSSECGAEILALCSTHSNYFALMLGYENLNERIKYIEESSEEKLLRHTETIAAGTRELKKILDSVQAGIIMADKSTGEIADVNIAAADMIGKQKEGIIGGSMEKYFSFDLDKREEGRKRQNEEGVLKKQNGELIPIIKSTTNIIVGNEEFTLASFLDISERKKMEEALQKAHSGLEKRVEERTIELAEANKELRKQIDERIRTEEEKKKLHMAVQQSPTSIIITDLKGDIEYVNPKFIEVSGFTHDEIIGQNPRIFKSNELTPTDYRQFWNTISSGNEWRGEFRNKKKNGELYWVSASVMPIKGAGGVITNYLAVEEDITDKKNFENELIIEKSKAEASDKLKSTLLENMSHEFRTPLIGILGFSQFLETEIEDPDHMEMIRDINLSGLRLLNTMDGVLQLAQLESTISLNACHLSNLSDDLHKRVISFHIPAKEKGLKFNVEILKEDLIVQIDSDLFNKALNYLVDNAIKYTNEGEITVCAEKSTAENGSDWVVINIRDTGIGINPKYHEIIFEAFRQASEGPSRNYEGTGLGLTIANKIIELMQGKIKLVSQGKQGSTFSIWLPAV